MLTISLWLEQKYKLNLTILFVKCKLFIFQNLQLYSLKITVQQPKSIFENKLTILNYHSISRKLFYDTISLLFFFF